MPVEDSVVDARTRLKQAAKQALDRLQAGGYSSGRVSNATASYGVKITPSAIRLLGADGDASGWRPPSLTVCKAIDQFFTDKTEELGPGPNLTQLRHALDAALSESKTHKAFEVATTNVIIGSPPLRALAFQPRDINEDLVRQSSGTPQPDRLLVGNGGTGKTQLAAYMMELTDEPCVKIWVVASSRRAITSAYHSAAKHCQLVSAVEQDEELGARTLLEWLRNTGDKWIIVLDDIVDPRDVRGFGGAQELWPRGSRGTVIATTRRRDLEIPNSVTIPIRKFDPKESSSYLTDRLASGGINSRQPTLPEMDTLAQELDQLPLALAQAASFISKVDGMSCAEYTERFHERSQRLADLFPETAPADGYSLTVATAWSLAIEMADKLEPEGIARRAMQLASVTDPAGAPQSLWKTGSCKAYLRGDISLTDSSAAQLDDFAVRRALSNLSAFSLIDLVSHGGGPTHIQVHSLVQRATREDMASAALTNAVRAQASSILELFDADSRRDDDIARNMHYIVENWQDDLWEPQAHTLLFEAANDVGSGGHAIEAVDRFQRIVDRASAAFGPDHEDVLSGRYGYANWTGQIGNAARAVELYKELLTDRTRLQGSDHPDCLRTRHQIAYWLDLAGDWNGARSAYISLLERETRLLGHDNLATLSTLNNLAWLEGRFGRIPEAISLLRHVAAEYARLIGPSARQTLTARAGIAEWLALHGDWGGALFEHRAVVAGLRALLGDRHLDTVNAKINMTKAEGHATIIVGGEYMVDALGDVVDRLEELTGELEQLVDSNHRDILNSRSTLVEFLGHLGEPNRALAQAELLLARKIAVLGDQNPEIFVLRMSMILLAIQSGQSHGLDETAIEGSVLTALIELGDDQERALGHDHPDTMTTREYIERLLSLRSGGTR